MSITERILTDPRWWAALTLDERRHGTRAVVLDDASRERGTDRLRLWTEGKLIPEADITLDRWYHAGLTEGELVNLLGEPVESLRDRLPEPPAWLVTIADAWRHADAEPAHDHDHTHDHSHGHGHGHGHGHEETCEHHSAAEISADTAFVGWVRPLLVWAHNELVGRVDALAALHGCSRSLPLGHSLFAPDAGRVLGMVKRVLVLELNVARVDGTLSGDTPAERFHEFTRRLADGPSALDLLAEYPVLARELVRVVQTWIEVRAEFVERLLTDLPRLRETFGTACDGLDDVAAVEFGAGDPHGGGRSVAVVTFADGGKLVYKPRNLSVDVHFAELTRWLNDRGLRHPLRTWPVLDLGDHGWALFISQEPCPDTAALQRFYWRQGAYLALFYCLRSSDFHLENLIAAGEHPAFVDLESMFQSAPKVDKIDTWYSNAAEAVMRDSVLSIGLLPQRIIEFDETGAHDLEVSGLAGGAGPDQLTPRPIVWFAGAATDEMRVDKQRRPIMATANRPTVDGAPVDLRDYRTHLLTGFEETYRLVLAHRDELLADDGPVSAFSRDEVRSILRHTSTYQELLDESWHPDVLRDSLDRSYLFEQLTTGHGGITGREPVIVSEIAQLAVQDIPVFRTTVDSVDLRSATEPVAEGFLETSGLAAVGARLNGLSAADLDQQSWCVLAALSALDIAEQNGGADPDSQPLPGAPIDTDLATAAAVRIGDELLRTALRADGSSAVAWLSLNLVNQRYWTVGPAGIGLYSGVSGIALFLAELGAWTGDDRYRLVAAEVAETLIDQIAVIERLDERRKGSFTLGGYEDLGAMMYLCTRLGELWAEPELLAAAHRLVPEIRQRFAADIALDIIGGTSGSALALLALHAAAPTESTVDALDEAHALLCAKAVPVDGGVGWPSEMSTHAPLLGFSHGASGHAYALARLSGELGRTEGLDLVGQALAFERRHFDPADDNWPDLRTINTTGISMNAWCHGAAGIGLARAAMLGMPVLDSEHDLIRADLRQALIRVRGDLVNEQDHYTGVGNDSICHGDLGLVETLRAAGDALGDNELGELAGRVSATIARRVLGGTVRSGVPFEVSTPSLMSGTAGVGHSLLRAADPGRVPSVLLLGEPRAVTRG